MGLKSKNKLLVNMIKKQRKDIKDDKRLDSKDLQRISRNISSSIFNKKKCSIWSGYVTYIKKSNIKYINFFHMNKKNALHRLLYANFVGDLSNNEYIKYKCENKGICCNINHFYKIENKINTLENTLVEKNKPKLSLDCFNNEKKKPLKDKTSKNKSSKDKPSKEKTLENKKDSKINIIKNDKKNELIIIF